MVEPEYYLNHSADEIEQQLISQGHFPALITEEPGDKLEEHQHPELHILAIVDGQMTLTLAGEETVLKPGDKVTIPSDTKHAAVFGPQGCKYFWVEE